MDGTVQREVLRSVLEEDAAAGPNSSWALLAASMTAAQKSRADYWSTAKYPYGSEFAYDTTGQEEVVVWLLYFNFDDAAERTVDHILSYMRSFPGWAAMGGASAGDIGNGGKWYVAAETGFAEANGKMHYRVSLFVKWNSQSNAAITSTYRLCCLSLTIATIVWRWLRLASALSVCAEGRLFRRTGEWCRTQRWWNVRNLKIRCRTPYAGRAQHRHADACIRVMC